MSGPPGLDPASADARFVVLYRDYHPLCYQVARSILRHHDQALDAVHEVFLQLLAGAPASLARALGPSFFRIAARNQAIGILRKRSVEYTALGRLRVEQESAGVISFPDLTAHLLLDPTVQRFLAGLPPLRARVFELCYGLGFSSREAAEELGVSQKAVEKQREKLERDLRRFRGGGEKWGAEAFIGRRRESPLPILEASNDPREFIIPYDSSLSGRDGHLVHGSIRPERATMRGLRWSVGGRARVQFHYPGRRSGRQGV